MLNPIFVGNDRRETETHWRLASQGHLNHQSSSKTSKTRLERGSICSHSMIKRTTVTVKWLYYTQLKVYFFDEVIVSVLLVLKIVGKNFIVFLEAHLKINKQL